jgi:hypothetical protein
MRKPGTEVPGYDEVYRNESRKGRHCEALRRYPMVDLELQANESRARHYGIDTDMAVYLRNWSDWLVCRPMSRMTGAPTSAGIFSLGYWAQQRGTEWYLVLPFYFGQAENLATTIVPQVDVAPVLRAYTVIKDSRHRELVLAALQRRQALDYERDSTLGSLFSPIRDLASHAAGRLGLPDSFPLLC